MHRLGFLFWSFAVLGFFSCAKVVFIGSSAHPSQFKPVPENTVSPVEAWELAKPHLEKTWRLRCKKLHHNDPHWCKNRKAHDYIVQKGKHYYITRTSYPYKTYNAYLLYAVRVHVESGELSFTREFRD